MDKPDAGLKTLTEDAGAAVQKVLAPDIDPRFGAAVTSFTDLGLREELLKGIFNVMKFERPSKVQSETLPLVLNPPFKNLIAQAHAGSGKTTCFVLTMLSRADPAVKEPQALCSCPTRELAVQNFNVCKKIGTYCTDVSIRLLVPGKEPDGRMADQIIVGTPGKIAQMWSQKKYLKFKAMKVLVFDEADNMMDGGFRDTSIRLVKEVKKAAKGCQILLFSATFNDTVKEFALRQIPNASQIFLPREELSLDIIKQYKVVVPTKEAKATVVKERIFELADLKSGQSIVFVRTRDNARKMHRDMEQEGHKCTSITSEMTPEDRDKVIEEFREGKTRILIATDVLSRGFDVSSVTLVINYDIPVQFGKGTPDYETYIHRVGRTGRLGKKGAAFNLLCGRGEEAQMASIEKFYNHQVEAVDWESDEAFEAALAKANLSS